MPDRIPHALTGSGPQLAITGIEVNGVALNLASLQPDGSGGFLITGLGTNDRIQVISANGFDRIEIENPSSALSPFTGGAALNGDSFDIGAFAYSKLESGTGAPLNFNFNLTATDSDGDAAAGSIALGTVPPTLTLNGTAATEALVGGTSNETINGLVGDDWLTGGTGIDTLTGGAGNDLLTSGAGADIFKWGTEALLAANADTVTDYTFAQGDKINLQSLVPTIANGTAINYVHVAGSRQRPSR